jgi:hypothetical protein
MHWCEKYPSRERCEFWIAADNGNDVKLTVHSRVMPARGGHSVNVLMLDDLVVGLANLTTGRQVNFVQADPPLLVQRCDGLGCTEPAVRRASSRVVRAAARARALPDAGAAADAGRLMPGDGRRARSRAGDAAKGQVGGTPGGNSYEWA